MNLVLSKVDALTVSPLNLVLRKRVVPPYTEAKSALFAWRFEDEPESAWQKLGWQTVGFAFEIPFNSTGREIRISMIAFSEDNVASQNDYRKGVQTTITPTSSIDTIVTHNGEIVTHNGEIVVHSF